MFLIRLAWKNLWRYGKRTLITGVALAMGILMFIFLDSWLKGTVRDSELNLVRFETAAMRVTTAGFAAREELLPLDEAIPEADRWVTALRDAGFDATARISFAGSAIVFRDPYPEDGSLPIRVVAIDPERDADVFRLPDTVDEGRWIAEGRYEAVVGSWFAEDIGAGVGYPLLIETRDFDGFRQTFEVEIVGTLTTGNPLINRGSIFVPRDVADDVLFMDGGATEISVALGDHRAAGERAGDVARALTREGADVTAGAAGGAFARSDAAEERAGGAGRGDTGAPTLTVRTWEELAADYLAALQADQVGSVAILGLIVLIAAIGVSNTMLMAIHERTHEIGVMQAIGVTKREIRAQFLLESAGIGVVGGAIGVALGAISVWFLVRYGISFAFITREMDIGYRIATTFYGVWNVGTMAVAFGFGIVASVAIAWASTRRIMRMDMIDTLAQK